MKNTIKIEQYDNFAIAENNELCILQNGFDFYKITKQQKADYARGNVIACTYIQDSFAFFTTSLFIIALSLIIYFAYYDYTLIDSNYMIATLILMINIPIHELGHILILKLFYKPAKVKIGFKFMFIFPAFYVDTSFSYLLPKYKKISVFLGGTLFNALFLLTSFILFPDMLHYYYVLIVNMLVNFLPIIKSDGYYSFMAIFNKHTFNKGKKRTRIEDFIRGFIMYLCMLGASYVL